MAFLSYRFVNEVLRGNEYPDGATTSVTLTGLTEGASFKVKARTRYSSGRANNRRWSGPWSDVVTASVSEAEPVAQGQVDDPQTQDDDQQQVDDPPVVDPVSQTQGGDLQGQRGGSLVVSDKSVARPASRCLRLV